MPSNRLLVARDMPTAIRFASPSVFSTGLAPQLAISFDESSRGHPQPGARCRGISGQLASCHGTLATGTAPPPPQDNPPTGDLANTVLLRAVTPLDLYRRKVTLASLGRQCRPSRPGSLRRIRASGGLRHAVEVAAPAGEVRTALRAFRRPPGEMSDFALPRLLGARRGEMSTIQPSSRGWPQ